MKDLSQNIVTLIKEKHVKPMPRWWFVARKIAFWVLFYLFITWGSISIAVSAYLFKNLDWQMYSRMGYNNLFTFFLAAFPVLFFALIAGSFVLATYWFRKTPKGHRLGVGILVPILFLFFLILALFMNLSGVGQEMHFQLAHYPTYHQMVFTKEREWSQPQFGLLWGEIERINDGSFLIKDMHQNRWLVQYSGNTIFEKNFALGDNVKITGSLIQGDTFSADTIQRWDGIMKCNGHRNIQ